MICAPASGTSRPVIMRASVDQQSPHDRRLAEALAEPSRAAAQLKLLEKLRKIRR